VAPSLDSPPPRLVAMAVVVHEESSAAQMLSEAPPDQWGTLLEVLGASLRPVGEHCEVDEAPCTVTSLIGMMDQVEQKQQVQQVPTKAERLAAGPGGRGRARRGLQRAIAAPLVPAEEDTRDLEELLRDLGEAPAGVAKTKKKAKTALKQPKEAVASPPPQPCAVPTAHVAQPQPCQAPQVRQEPSEAELPGETTCPEPEPLADEAPSHEAANESSSDEGAQEIGDEEAWQTVVKRATQRAVQGMQEETALEVDHSVTGGTTTTEVVEQDIAELVAQEVTVPGAATQGVGDRGCLRRRSRRSLSEGCRPQADAEESDEAPEFYERPSVATWLSRPLGLRHKVDVAPAAPSRGRGSEEQEALAVEQDISWHSQPSVGTWLHSHTVSHEARRANSRGPQLWPATPESTPPTSPRLSGDSGCPQMVWVPVPFHMLAEVQQVISRGIAARTEVPAGP